MATATAPASPKFRRPSNPESTKRPVPNAVHRAMAAFETLSHPEQEEFARGVCLAILARHHRRLAIIAVNGEVAGYLIPRETTDSTPVIERESEATVIKGRMAKLQRLAATRR